MNENEEIKDEVDIVDERKPLNFLLRFLKGIAIGIGAILPGLSGGVLAVIFGIYNPAIKFLGNIRYKFWKNVLFFIPAGLGLVLGIFLFSIVVEEAFKKYLAIFACLFIGFVIGTVPSLFKNAGEKGRNKSDIVTLVITSILLVALMIFGQSFAVNIKPSILVWALSGGLVSLGFIVPGLSPSNFLMYFGLYDKMAGGIKSLDLSIIIPLLIGAVITVLLLSKLVSFMFKKYYSKINHIILGLVIGSSIAIFPTVIIPEFMSLAKETTQQNIILMIVGSVVLFIVGSITTYFFSKLGDTRTKNEDTIKENEDKTIKT